jgi:GntR family transcriptional regulator
MAARGVVEDRLDHEISSRPASDDERRQFDLAPGVSVLVYQRIGWSEGDIIKYTCEVLPADRNVITHTTANAVEQVR